MILAKQKVIILALKGAMFYWTDALENWISWVGRSATSQAPNRKLGSPTTGVHDAISEQLCMHAFIAVYYLLTCI